MHHDIGVHLGDFHHSDGACVPIVSRLLLGLQGAWRGPVHPDVVELAVLPDHLHAGLADVRYGHSDSAAEVLGPLKSHDP